VRDRRSNLFCKNPLDHAKVVYIVSACDSDDNLPLNVSLVQHDVRIK
jgi:hypothetical protein